MKAVPVDLGARCSAMARHRLVERLDRQAIGQLRAEVVRLDAELTALRAELADARTANEDIWLENRTAEADMRDRYDEAQRVRNLELGGCNDAAASAGFLV